MTKVQGTVSADQKGIDSAVVLDVTGQPLDQRAVVHDTAVIAKLDVHADPRKFVFILGMESHSGHVAA